MTPWSDDTPLFSARVARVHTHMVVRRTEEQRSEMVRRTQTDLVHALGVECTVAHGRPERRALAHRRRRAALRGRDTAHVERAEVVLVEQTVREPASRHR